MDRARAPVSKRLVVPWCGVALVGIEPIAVIPEMDRVHDRVTDNLCDDRCRGHGQLLGVAFDNTCSWVWQSWVAVAIDQDQVRHDGQSVDGSPHRSVSSAEYVGAVYLG